MVLLDEKPIVTSLFFFFDLSWFSLISVFKASFAGFLLLSHLIDVNIQMAVAER